APHAAPLRPRQRALDKQQVGAPGEPDEVVRGPAVGAEDEPAAAARRFDRDREGLGEVRYGLEAEPQRADLRGVGRRVLLEGERVLDQLLGPPRSGDPAERLTRPAGRDQARMGRAVGAGPAVDGYRLLAGRVGERVRERDEVEEV